MGTETGVRCSAAGRLVSSCGINPASSLDQAVGCNLTWGQKAVRGCRCDPAVLMWITYSRVDTLSSFFFSLSTSLSSLSTSGSPDGTN